MSSWLPPRRKLWYRKTGVGFASHGWVCPRLCGFGVLCNLEMAVSYFDVFWRPEMHVWHSRRGPRRARFWVCTWRGGGALGCVGGVGSLCILEMAVSWGFLKTRKYNYRRNLPHIEKDDRPHFITFDTYQRWHLPPLARDIALRHCLHDNGSKMQLHVAVIMPDHVHLIFTPLRSETNETYSFEEIVGAI